MLIRDMDKDRVNAIISATPGFTSLKVIAERTKIPQSTVRIYCKLMAEHGRLETEGSYPTYYKRIQKKYWSDKEVEPNKDAIVELKKRIVSLDNDENELILLTQSLFRNMGGDKAKFKAVAKLYLEIGQAVKQIAEEIED